MSCKIKKNGYKHLNYKECAILYLEVSILQILLGYCFYNSWWGVLGVTPIGIYYYRMRVQQKRIGKREQIRLEFKEALVAMSTSLRAGYSIENACKGALSELEFLFGTSSVMYQEFKQIVKKLQNQQSIERVFRDMAQKLEITEMIEFAETIWIAKKYGGDLSHILQNTSDLIGDQVESNREIQTIISGKKMEQSVMNGMPIFIVCYMRITTPDYFQILYGTPIGILIMSICLGIYFTAYLYAEKILQIA